MAEYWVYLREPQAPTQDDVMTRMIQTNPFQRGGVSPIGAKEGLLWSDIRFHMALALRDKNAHIFRPDLFEPHVDANAEMLEALSECQALVKLRYVSEHRLPDTRHLQFLVYASEAVAELAGSPLVFDLISEKLVTTEWLQGRLRENPNGARRELHLRAVWRPTTVGGTAETRGLQKVGFPELSTPETMGDHRVVALQVLELAAERLWETGELEPRLTLEHFGDTFHVLLEPSRSGPIRTRILRENR
jgi:hypothetical protein